MTRFKATSYLLTPDEEGIDKQKKGEHIFEVDHCPAWSNEQYIEKFLERKGWRVKNVEHKKTHRNPRRAWSRNYTQDHNDGDEKVVAESLHQLVDGEEFFSAGIPDLLLYRGIPTAEEILENMAGEEVTSFGLDYGTAKFEVKIEKPMVEEFRMVEVKTKGTYLSETQKNWIQRFGDRIRVELFEVERLEE